MTRTKEQWLASALCKAAGVANIEMKQIYSLARTAGVDVSPAGYIGELFDAHVAGINNAREAWCAGEDGKAAEFVVWAAVCAGLAAHDPVYKASVRAKANASKGKGVPRVRGRSPVLNALRALIAEGLADKEILAALGDADGISGRVREGFPIEVCDPETTIEDDGILRWYLPGGDSEKPNQYPVASIKKRLSEFRKSG